MSIPILRGRSFDDSDREGRPLVAVVSQSAAQRFWPDRTAVGEHFKIDVPGPDYTIVGIAGDVHSASLEISAQPTIYVPYRQDAFPSMVFVLKTASSAAATANAIRDAVASVDNEQPIGSVMTMNEHVAESLQRRRYSVTLLSAFGVAAVLLAAVGLYSVLAFLVSQRRREIGVRIALGASTSAVMRGVLGEGMRLAAFGMTAGVALALMVARLMSALLFGVTPTDAVTFVGAASLLALIAVAASLVPALRASRVDPLVALRDE
jgi:putative ABC transport system permease protein